MVIYWPIHPRTQKQLQNFDLWEEALTHKKLVVLHPLGYHEMLRLNMDAKIMLTDSGGLQEECTVIGTPCMSLRRNTERPITLRENGGASILVGNKIEDIKSEYYELMNSKYSPVYPTLWDGKTANRCLESILNYKS
jgi:UDP-N-acetylglucosamine 2-epimerase (non-hydrolysing)